MRALAALLPASFCTSSFNLAVFISMSSHQQPTEKRFAIWFCVVFMCVGSLVFVFKRTDLFPWIGSCHAGGYSDDHYLAYCHNARYGDYEHYALYRDTEPGVTEALQQSDVLFVGNSNTQYGFSTQAVVDYFNSKSTQHYVMGFGQGAQSPVAFEIIQKHDLKPSILVANIDPFFSSDMNGTFSRVLHEGEKLDEEFDKKKRLQAWQQTICANDSSAWYRFVCRGSAETLYRARSNGHWLTDYYRPNLRIPVSESDALLNTVDESVEAANVFIDGLGLNRDCVILTLTPRTDTPVAFATEISDRLEMPLITPALSGLVTIDHSHLDSDSAERWSTAFLAEFDQHLDRCVN